jgi:starvation-inducible DNA-binding protein
MTTTAHRPGSAPTPFRASSELTSSLQAVLTDLIELSLQAKQAHGNVVGANFRDLHLQLDEVVALTRAGSDTIAERMRALGAAPDGRSATVAAGTRLSEYPHGEQSTMRVIRLILASAAIAVATMRTVHNTVDAEDPSTSDLLHTLIVAIEKHIWMLTAQDEARE